MTAIAWFVALMQGAATVSSPQVTARITPDSVGVGEPIMIELRVRAPLGTEIRFPAVPDSSEQVEPLDPRLVRDGSTSALVDRTAVYRLIAWDTGTRVIRFADITVSADGVEQRYRVNLPAFRVHPVLPADSVARVPRGPRSLLLVPGWWWRLTVGGVVVIALAASAWRVWRRRRSVAKDPGPDAADEAATRFAHAERLGLLEAGEPGRFALTHLEVMREYLAQRFPQASLSKTGREVSLALTGAEFPILPDRVTDLLLRCEPIAFAGARVAESEAREIAVEARAIVADVETAWRTRVAASTARPRRRRR